MTKVAVPEWIESTVWVIYGDVNSILSGGVVEDCFIEEEGELEFITFITNRGPVRCFNNGGKSIKFDTTDGSIIQMLPRPSV